MFANTCRHRGHELLAEGGTSVRRSIVCPYHAWTYDLAGRLHAAPGFREVDGFEPGDHGLVELPVRGLARLGVRQRRGTAAPGPFARARRRAGRAASAPYAPGDLVLAARHTYEVAANWKVIAENYHECYHCPLIHPELCQVTPPTSGDNYDLPGAWVGGSMDLRDGMATMSLDGRVGRPADRRRGPAAVLYLGLLPNLLVSAHPDYVMTHRLMPLAPGRTWVECSWYLLPGPTARSPTRRTPWSSGTSPTVRTGRPASRCSAAWPARTSAPGPFAPNEDAVARLARLVSTAYLGYGIVRSG